MGVIVDTSILIDMERKGGTVRMLLRRMHAQLGETNVGVSSVSIVELAHGIARAHTDGDRHARQAFSDEIIFDLPIFPLTVQVAQVADGLRVSRPQRAFGYHSKTS